MSSPRPLIRRTWFRNLAHTVQYCAGLCLVIQQMQGSTLAAAADEDSCAAPPGNVNTPLLKMAVAVDKTSIPPKLASQAKRIPIHQDTRPYEVLKTLPADPSVEDLMRFRGLKLKLPFIPKSSPTDRNRLGDLLRDLRSSEITSAAGRLQRMQQWLDENPGSPYAPSVHLEAKDSALSVGNFKEASNHAQKAWMGLRNRRESESLLWLAETALVEHARLLVLSGRFEKFKTLMASLADRPGHVASRNQLRQLRAGMDVFWKNAAESSLCGVHAYNLLAKRMGIENIGESNCCASASKVLEAEEHREVARSGMSAVMLADKVRLAGQDWRWIRRVDGDEVPAPSVAHWALGEESGHYVAVLESDGGNVKLTDKWFFFNGTMDASVFHAQSSGYYMVPASAKLPAGYVPVERPEAAKVHGRQLQAIPYDSGPCPWDLNPEGWAFPPQGYATTAFNPGGVGSCPLGCDDAMMGSIGLILCWATPGAEDEGCKKGKGSCGGMAVWEFNENLASVLVRDRPISYQPTYGPQIDWLILYRQLDQNFRSNWDGDAVMDTSGFGAQWTHEYQSYIKVKPIDPGDSATFPTTAKNLRVVASGAYFDYFWDGTSQTYKSRYLERPQLSVLAGNEGFHLTFHDGSRHEYTKPNAAENPTRFFLKRVVDAQGLALTLNYDGSNRITDIVDATGGVTKFGYKPDDLTDMKIRAIQDPTGGQAHFTYVEDASSESYGLLSSITDEAGIVSSFTYVDDEPGVIKTLTTPYGTTTFEYEGLPGVTGNSWAVSATDPEGYVSRIKHLELAQGDVHPFRDEPSPEPVPPATAGATTAAGFSFLPPDLEHGISMTLSWDRKQWREYQKAKESAPLTNPDLFAETTVWGYSRTGGACDIPLVVKRPGMAARWFNYPGQDPLHPNVVGSSSLPAKIAYQTEDQTGAVKWVMETQEYNALVLPTVHTDVLGRKTRNQYFTSSYVNNATWGTTVAERDLQYEQVYSGTTWYTLRAYTKYTADGLPGAVVEKNGTTTSFTYDTTNRQITEIAVSRGTANVEKTRFIYETLPPPDPLPQNYTLGSPSQLKRIERTHPTTASQWVVTDQYTYDAAGRVATHEDAEGYLLTYFYDGLDRIETIQHPDDTTEEFRYDRPFGAQGPAVLGLDPTGVKDRAGRWTLTAYNGLRQPVMTVHPDGSAVRYDWCSCGSISKLTDQLNQVTEWKRDILGRVTEKIRHGGVTKTSFTYEARSGRLSTLRRPKEQGAPQPTVTYRYYLDGRLRQEDYSDAGTPDVTYHYTSAVNGTTQDSLGRLRFVQDGLGTHTYSYMTLVTGLPTSTTPNGTGSLDFIDGPFANDDLNHNYDWRGRNNDLDLQTDDAVTITRSETRTWDKMGRPATVVNTLGTFTYGYDTLLGRAATLTAPQSLVTTFAYYPDTPADHRSRRLQGITHSRNGVQYSAHAYDYDTAGRITRWDRSTDGGALQPWHYRYNLRDELAEVDGPDGGNPAHRQRWAYDAGGNWLSRGTPGTMSARSHDDLNRLTQIGGAGRTTVEGWINEFAAVTVQRQGELEATQAVLMADPVNSGYRFRAEVEVEEQGNQFTVKAKDLDNQETTQQLSFQADSVTREFEYDANGNLTADKSGGVVQRSFTWDAKNRLKSVTVGANTWSWDYDWRDRRVKEKLNGTEVKRFIWADTEIIQERSGTNAVVRTHCFGGFMDASGTKKYLTTTDHLGSVREVIAANAAAGTVGSVQARYNYDAYQGPSKVSGTTVDASLLTIGRYYHHAGSGLELALYRAYDPELGRWLSEDPLGEEGGINLYGIVGNQAVARWDLLGLETQLTWGFGGTAAIVVGGHLECNFGVAFDEADPLNSKLFAHGQIAGIFGPGFFFGGGTQGGFGWAQTPTSTGFSSSPSIHGEVNAGEGPSVGGSVDILFDSKTGKPIGGGMCKGRAGGGIGLHGGIGVGANGYIGTPSVRDLLNLLPDLFSEPSIMGF